MKTTKKDRIKELLPLGLSDADIAKKMKTTVRYVQHIRWIVLHPGAYRRHLDRMQERVMARYKADPVYCAKRRQAAAEWNCANRERVRENSRATRARAKVYAEMTAKEARA